MENPPSIVATPIAAPIALQYRKLTFRNLYIRRSGNSEISIMEGQGSLGKRYYSDFPIYDGPGSNAKLVARAQGVTTQTGKTHQIFTIVFEIEGFKGSTLLTNGVITGGSDEWAIYGGTGVFTMASGVIKRKYVADRNDGNTDEYTMEVFCPILGGSDSQLQKSNVVKVGPCGGGIGGCNVDVKEPPQRIESVTIRSGAVIDSIAYTYYDKFGEKHSAGPWGGNGGQAVTFQLAPSEFVKEVSGTTGVIGRDTIITSIKFVTNVKTYGPFGQATCVPFSVPTLDNSSIVGFFGRTDGVYVDALGVYMRAK